MRRPSPPRQQGFGLLAFVILTMIVAFSLVVGYSGVLARTQLNRLPAAQQQYLSQAQEQILSFYAKHAYELDKLSMSNPVTFDALMDAANVRRQYSVVGAVTGVLTSPEGMPYRAIAMWLPSESDSHNPPDLLRFAMSGEFVSCSDSEADCAERRVVVFNSLEIQRAAAKETTARLERVAMRAQSYFKARAMQDPEHNVSVNYFRTPYGECTEARGIDLGCIDTYVPMVDLQSVRQRQLSQMAKSLGLSDSDVLSAWGLPIELSNKQDSRIDDSPYSMAFRAQTPAGTYLTVRAVQPF